MTERQKGEEKTKRIPIKIVLAEQPAKPSWLRVKTGMHSSRFHEIQNLLRDKKLSTVCQEAYCPNIGECFGKGTATFLIMGELCTRRCPFCDVAHGTPKPLDTQEPDRLAQTVSELKLNYVVLTSVNRDDLRDGGAQHFADCISKIRELNPNTKVEILTPDFRKRENSALEILTKTPPDVMNHNIETVPRLYRAARPGADYVLSLALLRNFNLRCPDIPTKSGLMLGLGETDEEVIEVMRDLRAHNVSMITIGQYLMPSKHHFPVQRYVTPEAFDKFRETAYGLGFTHVQSGAFVRSSYHAEEQAKAADKNNSASD